MRFEFFVIQAISVLLEMIVTYSYFEALLSNERNNRKYSEKTILFYLFVFIVLTAIQSAARDNIFVAPISLATGIILISYIYIGEWKNKISLSILLLLIFILSELGTGMIMSMFSHKSMRGMENNLLLHFQRMFVSKMTAFIIVKIIARFKNKHIYSLNIKSWFGIMLVPVTSIISLYAVVEIAYTIRDFKNNIYVLLIAICLITANVMSFNLSENELKNEEQKLRYQFLKRQLNDEKEYYNTLAETQKEIRRTSHDMKNSLTAILGSLDDGKVDVSKDKICKMINVSDNSLYTVYTGNIIVDTMLSTKCKRMKTSNITFKPICVISSLNDYDYIDFCIFLGNALDNAIEACEKLSCERYINLKIVEKDNMLHCRIENLVFTSSLGSPLTRCVLSNDINNIVSILNKNEEYLAEQENRVPKKFPKLHPHSFRHTFATRCFEKNLKPVFIMSIMGHSNYETTLSYTHLLKKSNDQQVSLAGSFV